MDTSEQFDAARILRVLVRGSLVFLALTGLVVGSWALFFPLDFYGAFPGCGRVWVSVDGPYNEHLVRDVGALNLGFGLLAAFGLLRPALVRPVVIGAATLCYNLPHFIYHFSKIAIYSPLDQALNIVALGLAILASVVLIVARGVTETPARAA
ncbi:MAG: hypothetical protein ACREVL_12155 [Solimonas sp.]